MNDEMKATKITEVTPSRIEKRYAIVPPQKDRQSHALEHALLVVSIGDDTSLNAPLAPGSTRLRHVQLDKRYLGNFSLEADNLAYVVNLLVHLGYMKIDDGIVTCPVVEIE